MEQRTVHTAEAAAAVASVLVNLDQRDAEPGTAAAIRAGHAAVKAIDEALRSLHQARQALVGELVAEQNRML